MYAENDFPVTMCRRSRRMSGPALRKRSRPDSACRAALGPFARPVGGAPRTPAAASACAARRPGHLPGGPAAARPRCGSHGARPVRWAAEALLGGRHGRAAHARAAAAAGAVLQRRPRGPHWGWAQLGAGQAGRQGRLEGGHHLGGGAAAAAHSGVWVADDDGVQRTGGLRADGAWRVLQGLQRVQHHVRSLLDRVLPLELPQLVQSRAHGLLDVLGRERAPRQHSA